MGGVLLRFCEVGLPQASLSSPLLTSSSPQASLPPLNSYTPIINIGHIFQGKNSRNCRTKAFWATPRCRRQLGKCSSNTEAFMLLRHVNTSRERFNNVLNMLLTNQSHPKQCGHIPLPTTGHWTLAWQLSSCVALGNSLDLSEPLFLN